MTTVLQLALVVVVWLVALIPAAIAALTLLTVKTVRATFRKAPSPPASVPPPGSETQA